MHWLNQIRRWRQLGLCSLLCLAVPGLAMAQTQTSTPTAPAKPAQAAAAPVKHHGASAHKKSSRSKKGARKRGQKAIDATRARQIQEALIREHYMQGQPTGVWDSASQAAMQRYQADHGWQSKTTPDSRALINLGLGPSPDHLLNPESAMTTPAAPAAATDPKATAKPTPAADPKQ